MEARLQGVTRTVPAVDGEYVYSFDPNELEISSHWQNFIDCVRSRAVPRCDIYRGFEEAATMFMSIEAYKRKTMVRWDPETEEIVS